MRGNRLWTLLAISIALHMVVFALLRDWVIWERIPRLERGTFSSREIPAVYDSSGNMVQPAETLYQVRSKMEPFVDTQPPALADPDSDPEEADPPLPGKLQPGDELSGLITKSDRSPASFFGMQPQGRHIVFLVDISGSMLQRENGERRLDIVFREIKQLVAKLPDKSTFNVVLFAENAQAFSSRLVPSTFNQKAALFRFLNQENDCGSGTNLNTGLTVAMGMKPDTILLVTDGEANQSPDVVAAEAGYLMQKANKLISIQAVGLCLKPDSRAENLLKRLARESGGSYTLWTPPAKT